MKPNEFSVWKATEWGDGVALLCEANTADENSGKLFGEIGYHGATNYNTVTFNNDIYQMKKSLSNSRSIASTRK